MRLLLALLLLPMLANAQSKLLPAAVAADPLIAAHWYEFTEEFRTTLTPILQAHAECGPQRDKLAATQPDVVKQWLVLLATRNDILARAEANNSFIQQTQQRAKEKGVKPESLLTPEQTAEVLSKSNRLKEEKKTLDADLEALAASSPETVKTLIDCQRTDNQLESYHQAIRTNLSRSVSPSTATPR